MWNYKRQLAAKTGSPVISCGLNVPYPLKMNEDYKKILKRMAAGLREFLDSEGIRILHRRVIDGAAGYMEVFAVRGEVEAVKRACVEYEETVPAGRLLDADVMGKDGIQISRRDLELEERRCYLCGRPARYCCASAAHSQDEVIRAVKRILLGYTVKTYQNTIDQE